MSKQQRYEYPIAPGYADYWTIPDAIRELYANALDKVGLDPSKVGFHYDDETNTLTIENSAEERMTARALVLGASAKDESEIGRFGEGMKMAYLTLLRNELSISTYNVGEVWTPAFAHSETYEGPVLIIDREVLDETPSKVIRHTVQVDIENVRKFMESCLTFYKYVWGCEPDKFEVDEGQILLGSTSAGRIFVGGMLVSGAPFGENAGIGVNVKPEFAKLGRDRKTVDSEDEDLVWVMLAKAYASFDAVREAVNDSFSIWHELHKRGKAVLDKQADNPNYEPTERDMHFVRVYSSVGARCAEDVQKRIKTRAKELFELDGGSKFQSQEDAQKEIKYYTTNGSLRWACNDDINTRCVLLERGEMEATAQALGLINLLDLYPELRLSAPRAVEYIFGNVPETEQRERLMVLAKCCSNTAGWY